MNPMSRFAVFTVSLVVLVAIGSQNGHGGNLNKSLKSMCVCVPARAGLIMKSAIAKTQAQSVKLLTATANSTQ